MHCIYIYTLLEIVEDWFENYMYMYNVVHEIQVYIYSMYIVEVITKLACLNKHSTLIHKLVIGMLLHEHMECSEVFSQTMCKINIIYTCCVVIGAASWNILCCGTHLFSAHSSWICKY